MRKKQKLRNQLEKIKKRMIDFHLIQGAVSIRKKYLEIIDDIDKNRDELMNLSNFLNKKLEDLQHIQNNEFNNKPTKEEINRVTNIVIKEIEDIEINERRLSKKFEKLNEELEILRRDENELYKTLKSKYPNLSDEQIKNELSFYLNQ